MFDLAALPALVLSIEQRCADALGQPVTINATLDSATLELRAWVGPVSAKLLVAFWGQDKRPPCPPETAAERLVDGLRTALAEAVQAHTKAGVARPTKATKGRR